jgi:hypothetical protein
MPDERSKQATMSTRIVQLVLVLTLLSATLLASTACSIGVDIGRNLQDIAQKAIDQVDNLNATLGEASAGWQDTIRSSIDQLTDTAQHIVRDDLSNTLNRAIQAGGIELRCGGGLLARPGARGDQQSRHRDQGEPRPVLRRPRDPQAS